MSMTRLIKRTVKMSANALIFISAFFTVGKINTINPKINPINEMINKTVAKIVSVSILFNFLIVNISFVLVKYRLYELHMLYHFL